MVQCTPDDDAKYEILRQYRMFLHEHLESAYAIRDYRVRPNKLPREFYRTFISLLTRQERALFTEKMAEGTFHDIIRLLL